MSELVIIKAISFHDLSEVNQYGRLPSLVVNRTAKSVLSVVNLNERSSEHRSRSRRVSTNEFGFKYRQCEINSVSVIRRVTHRGTQNRVQKNGLNI